MVGAYNMTSQQLNPQWVWQLEAMLLRIQPITLPSHHNKHPFRTCHAVATQLEVRTHLVHAGAASGMPNDFAGLYQCED